MACWKCFYYAGNHILFPGSKLLNENNWIPASTSWKWRSDIGMDKFEPVSTTSESKGYNPETRFPYLSNWCIKISILEDNCHAWDSMFHLAIQLETSIAPGNWGREKSNYCNLLLEVTNWHMEETKKQTPRMKSISTIYNNSNLYKLFHYSISTSHKCYTDMRRK